MKPTYEQLEQQLAAARQQIEALAAERNGELETYSKTALEFREAARDENRHLKLELEIAEKRIAELEPRTVTVKLPETTTITSRYSDEEWHYYSVDDIQKMLSAAGIQIQGGE